MESRQPLGWGAKGVEGLNKKEKQVIDMDNSMVIDGRSGV